MERQAQPGDQTIVIGDRVLFTNTGQVLDGEVYHATPTHLWVELLGIVRVNVGKPSTPVTTVTQRRHAFKIPISPPENRH